MRFERVSAGNCFHDRRVGGQSLVEVVVLCAVLVPMFLLVPVLAKYIHIRQQVQQTTRAVAWQATVSPDYAMPDRQEMRNLAVERFFAKAEAKITSNAGSASTDENVADDFTRTFTGQSLLKRSDIRLPLYSNEEPAGIMRHINGALSAVTGGEFPPSKAGLVTANMKVDVQDLKVANGGTAGFLEPFDRLGLSFKASHVLLTDPWNAAGSGIGDPSPRSVLAKVKPLVPSAQLKPVSDIVDSIPEWVPMIGALGKLEIGYIEPDVVPVDKLKPYAPEH